MPQPGGALDSPGPLLAKAAAHASSRCACTAEARTRTSPSGSSAAPIATAVCHSVRIHPDHHSHHARLPIDAGVTVAGMPYFRDPSGVRASFEPRHGEEPTGWHVVNKPGRKQPAGGSRASPWDL